MLFQLCYRHWKCCSHEGYQKLSLVFRVNRTKYQRRICRNLTSSSSSTSSSSADLSSAITGENIQKVVFLGSDSFSVCSLQVLLKLFSHENITIVVSNDKNIVGKFSKKNQLKVVLWEEFKTLTKFYTADDKFDVGVVSSFGFLIPKHVIESCRIGILNVHASLLPRWRGAAPIAQALMNGDKETGITIMKIAPHKFDVGPILNTKIVQIPDHMKAPELTSRLATLGAEALEEVLSNLPLYLDKSVPQNINDGTLAPRLMPEIAQIKWDSQTPFTIYNLFRGLYGTFKLRTNYDNRRVDLDEIMLGSSGELSVSSDPSTEISVVNFPSSGKTKFIEGHILFWNKLICVKCFNSVNSDDSIKNNWIFIKKLKIGTKWMSASDFSNGFLSKSKGDKFFEFSDDEDVGSANSTKSQFKRL